MTALLLQPLSVRTSKDITDTSATITIGVPQGESFSCTLFNIFQDTLLEKLSSVPHHTSGKAASALADDVILMSKTAEGLQLLLENCTEWSAEYQMAWNAAPGKSEVLLPPRGHQTVYILPIRRTTAKCGIVCIPWRFINHIRSNWREAHYASESCTAPIGADKPNGNPYPRVQYESLCDAKPCVRQIYLRIWPPSRTTHPIPQACN